MTFSKLKIFIIQKRGNFEKVSNLHIIIYGMSCKSFREGTKEVDSYEC